MTEFVIQSESDREVAITLLQNIKLGNGKRFRFGLVRWVPKRTLSQNALAHLFSDAIADDTGADREATWNELKRRFLTPVEYDIMGERVKVYTTKGLSVAQESQFIDQISALAGEYGILLPTNREER